MIRHQRLISLVFTALSIAARGQSQPAEKVRGQQEFRAESLVVMLEATFDSEIVLGAGIIFGMNSERVFIATANHLVRRGPAAAKQIEALVRWTPLVHLKARLHPNSDTSLDLAVIDIDRTAEFARLSFDALGDIGTVKVSDRVRVIGYPNARPWSVQSRPAFPLLLPTFSGLNRHP